jgi:hypothetical protein
VKDACRSTRQTGTIGLQQENKMQEEVQKLKKSEIAS